MATATDRLHGHAYTPFWSFNEPAIYMERETNDQWREAQHRMWDQAGKDADLRKVEVRPEPIFMRWEKDDLRERIETFLQSTDQERGSGDAP